MVICYINSKPVIGQLMVGNKKQRTRAEIKRLAGNVKPEEFSDLPSYFKALYMVYKGTFKPYSYYHFSEDMGLGYCPTSRMIVSGDRTLTEKTLKKICDNLGIVKQSRSYLLKLAAVSSRLIAADAMDELIATKTDLVSEESQDQLAFFRHWYNAALLEFLRFYDGPHDPATIGSKMMPKVAKGKITESLKLLQRLRYIEHDPSTGRYKNLQKKLSTEREVKDLIFQSYHSQFIGIAKESVTRHHSDDRTVIGTTIATSPAMKRKIIDLAHELTKQASELSDEEGESPEEVSQLNIQFFPVARK